MAPSRPHRRPLLLLAPLLILATPLRADLADDLARLRAIEAEARRESLALLGVIKTMAPAATTEAAIRELAKIVQDGAPLRDTREPQSRVLVQARLNDVFPVAGRDDGLLQVRLPDGRLAWLADDAAQVYLDEAPVHNVAYTALPDGEMRRSVRLADDLMARIAALKEEAEALAAVWLEHEGPVADARARDELRARLAAVLDLHNHAAYFHGRYIAAADLSLAAGSGFRRALSGWAEFLLGSSSFGTEYAGLPADEADGTLLTMAAGGELELSPRSRLEARAARRDEVNQTAYGLTDLSAAYRFAPDEDRVWRGELQLHGFADEQNPFNDFSRRGLRLSHDRRRAGRRAGLSLDYGLDAYAYENTPGDDYTRHALVARAVTGDRRRPVTWQLRADLERSDAAFHDFTRLEPSLQWGRREGGTAWRVLYESLSYGDAALRSYGRAELRMQRAAADGPRRRGTLLAFSRKSHPDNERLDYLQLRGRLERSSSGPRSGRTSLSFFVNLFTEVSAGSYTDLRLDTSRRNPTSFRSLALFGRIWHDPGEGPAARAHVIDALARLGRQKGSLRYGPQVGAHLLVQKGQDLLERDGNLLRVGGFFEGGFAVGRGGRVAVNASVEYGTVWTEAFTVAADGTLTPGEVQTRHPTTLQLDATGDLPVGENLDLSARLNLYRIATDMDAVYENPDPGLVTDNRRTTIFVGVRYRTN